MEITARLALFPLYMLLSTAMYLMRHPRTAWCCVVAMELCMLGACYFSKAAAFMDGPTRCAWTIIIISAAAFETFRFLVEYDRNKDLVHACYCNMEPFEHFLGYYVRGIGLCVIVTVYLALVELFNGGLLSHSCA